MTRAIAAALLLGGCVVKPSPLEGAGCTLDGAHACPEGMFCVKVEGADTAVCSTSPPPPPPRGPTEFFISPVGDDDGDGGEGQPWTSWPVALSRLQPGDTLTALDGVWTDVRGNCPSSVAGLGPCKSRTILPDIDCTDAGRCNGDSCKNGTPELPITVRAQHERRVLLKSDGELAALRMNGCSYWRLEGLHGQQTDRPPSGQSTGIVNLQTVHDVTLSKLLVANTNRYANSYALYVGSSHDVTLEDCEAYRFHGSGFFMNIDQRMTLRRCYANSQLWPNLDGGLGGGFSGRGDVAFDLRGLSDSVVENCASENNSGFVVSRASCQLDAGSCAHVRIIGSISVDDVYSGFFLQSSAPNRANVSFEDSLTDVVTIRIGNATAGYGINLADPIGATVRNASVWASTFNGILAADQLNGGSSTYCSYLEDAGLPCGARLENVLAVGNAARGVAQYALPLSIDSMNGWQNGSGNLLRPDASVQTNVISVDPTGMGLDGGCLVYVPPSSSMHGAASNGGDIGANIIYRSVDGGLTSEKLWSEAGFPCGAVVAGVNDDRPDASSCITLHQRVNIGTPGCPVP